MDTTTTGQIIVDFISEISLILIYGFSALWLIVGSLIGLFFILRFIKKLIGRSK